jgi:hypothetical protein
MFVVIVSDIGGNETPLTVAVEVKNVASRPPVWVRPFASDRFDENTNQTYLVQAVDGDRGINTEICYKVEFDTETNCKFRSILINVSKIVINFFIAQKYITIESATGVINVAPIDRDAEKKELFPFNVRKFIRC